MLEKTNSISDSLTDSSLAKSLRSPAFSDVAERKWKKKQQQQPAVMKGVKRRSASPAALESSAAANNFGSTESLQREHLKRLRKDKGPGGENECAPSGKLNGSSKASARKSINPRRVPVSMGELATAAETDVGAATKPKNVVDGGTAAKPKNVVDSGAVAKPKIDVDDRVKDGGCAAVKRPEEKDCKAKDGERVKVRDSAATLKHKNRKGICVDGQEKDGGGTVVVKLDKGKDGDAAVKHKNRRHGCVDGTSVAAAQAENESGAALKHRKRKDDAVSNSDDVRKTSDAEKPKSRKDCNGVSGGAAVKRNKEKDGGGGPSVKDKNRKDNCAAADVGSLSTNHERVNGLLCEDASSARVVAPQKVKIDFEMEESDEDIEGENEGLKRCMEDIDKDLDILLPKAKKSTDEEEKEEEVRRDCFSGSKVGTKSKRDEKRPITTPFATAPGSEDEDIGDKGEDEDCVKSAEKKSTEENAESDDEVLCIGDDAGKSSKKGVNDKTTKVVEEVIDIESSLEADGSSDNVDANAEEEDEKEKDVEEEEEDERSRAKTKEGGKEEESTEKRLASMDDPEGVKERNKRTKGKVLSESAEEANAPMKSESNAEADVAVGAAKDGPNASEGGIESAVKAEDVGEEKVQKKDEAAKKIVKKEEKDENKKDLEDMVCKMNNVGVDLVGRVTPRVGWTVKLKREDEEQSDCKKRKLDDGSVDVRIVDNELKNELKAEEAFKEEQEDEEELSSGAKAEPRVYHLTKSELEMLVINKVTEFFSDSNKSELGALRNRCEHLEKQLELWKRKGQSFQKRLSDINIALQKARQTFIPTRPPMRSVGLQVQLTRYIPADPSKLASRAAQMGVPVTKPQVPTAPTNQKTMLVPKNATSATNNQLSFVANFGNQLGFAGTSLVNKTGMPLMSNVGTTATVNTMLTARPMTSTFSIPTRPNATTTVGQLQQGQMGVSLLQPRGSSLPGSFIIGSPLNVSTPNSAGGATIVRTPGNIQVLRTAMDPATSKVASSTGTPVPTCLVQNQSLTNIPATSTATPSAAATLPTTTRASSLAMSLIGQPSVVSAGAGVKLIDLTADEEDAAAKAQAALSAAAAAAASTGAPAMTMIPASLCGANGSVTVLAPVSSTAGGQLLTLAPIVSNAGGTSIRMAAPIRGPTGQTIVSNGSMRVTYLMPTSSVMSMVRPNQQVIMTAAPVAGARAGQPGGPRQPLPTIVVQRGTTLIPYQQGQITQMPSVRQGTIISSPTRTISMPSGPLTLVGPPAVSRPANSSAAAATTTVATVAPPVATYSAATNAANAKTANAAVHPLKHPAPLPPQPKYDTSATLPKRNVPPKPVLKISKGSGGIVLSWNMPLNLSHAEIASYQLFAYQEGSSAPSTSLWKKVGDVKALPLPMACTLTQFMEGQKYYFAVRAVDTLARCGPFSDPSIIGLVATAANAATAPAPSPASAVAAAKT